MLPVAATKAAMPARLSATDFNKIIAIHNDYETSYIYIFGIGHVES